MIFVLIQAQSQNAFLTYQYEFTLQHAKRVTLHLIQDIFFYLDRQQVLTSKFKTMKDLITIDGDYGMSFPLI